MRVCVRARLCVRSPVCVIASQVIVHKRAVHPSVTSGLNSVTSEGAPRELSVMLHGAWGSTSTHLTLNTHTAIRAALAIGDTATGELRVCVCVCQVRTHVCMACSSTQTDIRRASARERKGQGQKGKECVCVCVCVCVTCRWFARSAAHVCTPPTLHTHKHTHKHTHSQQHRVSPSLHSQ